MATMQKITTNLWFNGNAEEAVNFYTSIFKTSSVGRMTRYGKAGFEFHKKPEGTPMTIEFELEGQQFVALNAGNEFPFTEAISFIVNCDSQEEVDYYWDKLSEGADPNAQVCGWLKDKFGVSWQVVPTRLATLLTSGDAGQTERVSQAIFTMKKLDLETLNRAFAG